VGTSEKQPKEKKTKAGQVPEEQVREILNMNPEDLAIEAARDEVALAVSKEQLAEDTKLKELKGLVESAKDKLQEHVEILNTIAAIQDAREALNKLKEDNMSEDHTQALITLSEAKENQKAYEKGWKNEMRTRVSRLRLMKKTLRKHMGNGVLKSRVKP
jgi:uncharacterized FlgJ-related protein